TREKTYAPAALSPQEEEIRRSGGIIKIGRREFPDSVRRSPDVKWPDAPTAQKLTSTEQILWAHRVDKDAEVRPGATLRVYADLLPASDGTAPFSIHTFNEITGGDTIRPRQIAIANDHFVFNHREADDKQTGIGREFAERHGIASPYYATPGDGIFHFSFPEQKLALLARWGQKQAQGMSVEFVDAKMQLPMSYRNTIANMMAEGEALNGIFAPDDLTYAWYREKGAIDLPYPRFAPGADARYEIDETLDLSEAGPLIA